MRTEVAQMKVLAERIGAGVLVLLLVAAVMTGPAWMVVALVLFVPLAAVVWETTWARLSRTKRPPPPSPPGE